MNTSGKFSFLARIAAGLVVVAALFIAAPAASADTGTAASEPTVVKGDDIDTAAAWDCVYGYPCLYPAANGNGTPMVLKGCGFFDLRSFANQADSARTYANTVTVWNWNTKTQRWENYGTIPAWKKWNFTQPDTIDGATVNC